jgi:hypothetical protein
VHLGALLLRVHLAPIIADLTSDHGKRGPVDAGTYLRSGRPAASVRLGDLTACQAEQARERYALPSGALVPGHDRHPLTLRLLAEVRRALPADVPGQPDSEDVFGAHLDLMCLRIAVRIAAASRPALRGTAVRGRPRRLPGGSTRPHGAVWDRGRCG